MSLYFRFNTLNVMLLLFGVHLFLMRWEVSYCSDSILTWGFSCKQQWRVHESPLWPLKYTCGTVHILSLLCPQGHRGAFQSLLWLSHSLHHLFKCLPSLLFMWFLAKVQKLFNEKKKVFSTNGTIMNRYLYANKNKSKLKMDHRFRGKSKT